MTRDLEKIEYAREVFGEFCGVKGSLLRGKTDGSVKPILPGSTITRHSFDSPEQLGLVKDALRKFRVVIEGNPAKVGAEPFSQRLITKLNAGRVLAKANMASACEALVDTAKIFPETALPLMAMSQVAGELGVELTACNSQSLVAVRNELVVGGPATNSRNLLKRVQAVLPTQKTLERVAGNLNGQELSRPEAYKEVKDMMTASYRGIELTKHPSLLLAFAEYLSRAGGRGIASLYKDSGSFSRGGFIPLTRGLVGDVETRDEGLVNLKFLMDFHTGIIEADMRNFRKQSQSPVNGVVYEVVCLGRRAALDIYAASTDATIAYTRDTTREMWLAAVQELKYPAVSMRNKLEAIYQASLD